MLTTAQLAASIANITGGAGGGTSYSLAITNDPATGTLGSVVDFSGTVAPSGQAVQFGLSSSNTTFSGGTFAGGTLGAATVSGTLWNDYVTLNTAGTFYPFGEITGQTTVVGSGIVVSGAGSNLTFSYIAGQTPSGGATALSVYNSGETNLQTPLAHGSSVTPAFQWTIAGGASVSGNSVLFWFDTSPTNLSSSAGTVASGTLNTSSGVPGNQIAFFGAGNAPATAGTYYAKVLVPVTGTDAGTYVFTSQAITVT